MLELPLCDQQLGLQTDDTESTAAPAPTRKLKVVVIDDRRDSSYPVVRFLSKCGHQVEVASDGPQGLAAVEQAKPDLVICDIGLPGIDGYEVAQRIRGQSQLAGIKLFALTGYWQPSGSATRDRRRIRRSSGQAGRLQHA